MSKKKLKKTYQALLQSGREFVALEQDSETHVKLSPGSYKIKYNGMTGQLSFIEFNSASDKILDLPSEEFTRVVGEMKQFLDPVTKAKFLDMGFLYKRSALLFGKPGTGKTVIVNRIMQEVIGSGGICLFVDDPRVLSMAYDALDDLQPNTTVLTVLEEFDGMIKRYGEDDLLSILDGEIQKQNVMYLATTNYIDKIPKRMIRPGRISSVIEVHFPSAHARTVYFSNKLGGKVNNLQEFIDKTSGLSVDELKEVVQSVYIFGNHIDEVVARILKAKGQAVTSASYNKPMSQSLGNLEMFNSPLPLLSPGHFFEMMTEKQEAEEEFEDEEFDEDEDEETGT